MKNTIKFLFFITVNTVFSQQAITDTGTNVGIGTTTPDSESRLHVVSPSGVTDFTILATSVGVNNWSGFYQDALNNFKIQARDGSGILKANIASSGDSWLNGGNVGIGTASPSSKLQISGQIDGDFNGLVIDNRKNYGTNSGTNETSRLLLTLSENGAPNPLSRVFGIMEAATLSETDSSNGRLSFYVRQNGNAEEKVRILSNGNVGIGTTDTKGFKLGVQGKIAAEEVKVAMYSNWADFVFENSYNLPTLKEVEQHIKEKGHLKDIPSAEEVKENGIFLGEMDSKLLQKIEELTLYTINQEKRIEALESKNEKLLLLVEKLLNKKIEE
ncbi:hypothetical protein CJ739_1745 [Mariniflexile rhizosphaerae]|uniref:hypothetical protein n=1 Tax=unclassified Mariniflexile TaxID=2643887 RepID=UPI000E336090|nr:hypothetical protein [Mariniflexile sp. TRM1-10]AXP80831.1 hypothetical protein CJ739_1745 [Mariniflexile sp. TRM1-10]